MKKALAGPAKRPAKKKPERRAMIAATRRRLRALAQVSWTRARGATARLDRGANRLMVRVWPPASRLARRVAAVAKRWARWVGRRLRPVGVLLLRAFSVLERRLLRARDLAIRIATRASAVLTPERAICGVIFAAGACLIVSQFVDYSAVEVGQPGYAGLPAASPPLIDGEAAGAAHAYLLVPVGAIAAALALLAVWTGRNRLGRVVFALGLVSLAVVLLVDRPAGLDAGAQTSRFSGATAVLQSGFYAELAAASGLMLGGLLLILSPRLAARYHARPCRTRTSLFARAASALRRRRRRRASSRGRVARRGSRRRSGVASAPASRP
jgi:hypothetical protein